MLRRRWFFVMFLFLPLLSILAAASSEENGASYQSLLTRGEKYEKQGKLQQARKVYEKILNHEDLSSQRKELVREKYEKVSMKLLYSRQEMPESDIYKVKAGDSLYKIARRYGTTVALLKKSNQLKSDTIHPDQKLKVLKSPFSIRVDKSDNVLILDLGGKALKRYRVSTGKDNSTPTGKFRIKSKLENPTWYYAGAVVPPGSPDNYLGTRWMGFDLEGYGIHGTTFPDSIGKQESLGCVRLLNKDAEELYDLVPEGARVIIQD